MTIELSDEQSALFGGLASFIDSVVVPLEQKHATMLESDRLLYRDDGRFSGEVLALLAQVRTQAAAAGYYTMFAPAEFGGGALGPVLLYRAWEFVNHRYGPGRLLPYQVIAHWATGPSFLCGLLSPALKSSVVADLMSGANVACFAMSEPDAGSDAWAMTTSAVRDGAGWRLNGCKQWITNGPTAKYAWVFAVTDREMRDARRGGVSCFLVPTDAPGFEVGSVIKIFGEDGGNEAILTFDDVYLEEDWLVGPEHEGFKLALEGVSDGRMYNAGRLVGLARWALERAVSYATDRRAFGKPISEHQGVSFQLAEIAIEIYAAKAMSLDCAERLQKGDEATREVAMVKAFTSEMCFRAFDRAIQVHGGMGLTNEMKLYDGWHQARALRIADGTAEVMRRNIAKALIRGNVAI